jgi:cytochrome c-type biogenesis protein CcmF
MTPVFGNLTLCLAVLVAVATLLVALRAARFPSPALLCAARGGVVVLAALLTLASATLMVAMLTSDFRLEYVGRYTERALPTGYKAAAFWAGQQGSLLLWGWLLAAMGVVFVLQLRRESGAAAVVAAGAVATVVGFFAALMLFAANPFDLASPIPPDGHGLNPMLQDPGMIAHPPILFIGYAGFTMPFALLLGALVTRRLDSTWLDRARPWVLVSWIFLGAGILLGAQWAYVELGWGGYWAWDPVENASLLPWLTATALLHSAIGQGHRGMFKRWNAVLAALTFILCIFGTYITRSGVVDSVHTFGKSVVGTFFGVFLVGTVAVTVALVALRWNDLRPERQLKRLVSREGAFLAANVGLVAMMLVTLFGTMFPVFSRSVTGNAMSVSQSFYNHGVLPVALALVSVMALAPVLTYGGAAMDRLLRGVVPPLALGLASVVAGWAMGLRSAWALAAGAACAVLLGSVVIDVVRSVRSRQRNTHEGVLVAALRLLDGNHRRYGSHVVHTGIVMIVAGIAGSSLYGTRQLTQLAPGQSAAVGKYTVRLEELRDLRGPNYTAVQSTVTVTDARGHTEELRPQRRFYDKAEDASSEVAIRSNWAEDLYINLAGWEAGGKLATLQVIVNPLVRWIWAGGVVLTLGAVFCLMPKFAGRAAAVAAWPIVVKGVGARSQALTANPAPAAVRPPKNRKERRRRERELKVHLAHGVAR